MPWRYVPQPRKLYWDGLCSYCEKIDGGSATTEEKVQYRLVGVSREKNQIFKLKGAIYTGDAYYNNAYDSGGTAI